MTQSAGDPHTWLEADALRRTSDVALGALLLVLGILAIWQAGELVIHGMSMPGAGFFPSVVGGLLDIVAIGLLVRGLLRRSPNVRRSRPRDIAVAAAVIGVSVLSLWAWGNDLFLGFGPAEFALFIALELAVAATLAHTSRSRAAGMALLGLLLSTVGLDPATGTPRFTMGTEALLTGIDVTVVLLGLFVVTDAILCLVAPSLLLATYARLITGWRAPAVAGSAALAMRAAAALALIGACYYSYLLRASAVDVVSVLGFGVFGVGAKIFGWNRFVLYMAFALGTALEQSIAQSILLANGDPLVLMRAPISAVLLLLTGIVLAAAITLSLKRPPLRQQPALP